LHPADFFGRTSQISVASSGSPLATVAANIVKTALMFNGRGDANWRHNLSGAPELWWPVGILFLFGVILSLFSLFKKESRDGNRGTGMDGFSNRESRFTILFLFAWLVIGSLPEILSNDGIPHALRSLLMVIPVTVFAAIGGVWTYDLVTKKWSGRWRNALLALLIAASVSAAYVMYFKVWAENSNVPGAFNADYVAIGNAVNALPTGVQKYVVVYAGGVTDYGIPTPAMPVMFVTHSFVPDAVAQKFVHNIHYLLPGEIGQIPFGTPRDAVFEIR
jgi:hypothetical protein